MQFLVNLRHRINVSKGIALITQAVADGLAGLRDVAAAKGIAFFNGD